jgi:peptidoglycan/LPS O-acetylase OafA/YrhL
MTVATSKPHLPYIDCLRGYAVLMVMTVHLTQAIPELPYPVARFTKLGWYGVQLFFLMSALTLLSSWRAEVHRNGAASIRNFFIRRFLRIAPAYYTAALLYSFAKPHFTFDLGQLAAFLSFANSWHPATMPTLADRWTVVPGGWSIGVEFSFYALFPILASAITTLRQAGVAVIAAIVLGFLSNLLAAHLLGPTMPKIALENFLYFWLPDQLSVFMLGMTLYYLIGDNRPRSTRLLNTLRPFRYWLALAAVLAFLSTSFVPLSHYFGQSFRIPEKLFIAIPLMLFATALACGPTLFVNRAAQEMGKVSFSAYLLHFLALNVMDRFPSLFGLHATGIGAIGALALDWVVLVITVFLASLLLYKTVELPGMRLAQAITKPSNTKRNTARA